MFGETRKTWWLGFLCIPLLALYALFAARPVRDETVLRLSWLVPLDARYAEERAALTGGTGQFLPFRCGARAGYVDSEGRFALLTTIDAASHHSIAMSGDAWALYDQAPEKLEVYSPPGDLLFTVNEPRGYPLFCDGRTFLVSFDQNSVSALAETEGTEREAAWNYDFASPVTCLDAAGGFLAAGLLDGSIEVIDCANGVRVFFFEPGGSRIPVITGIALSADARYIAVISGIDEQRFIILEKNAAEYQVKHHEFLGEGFRRPVFVQFSRNGKRVIFERAGGVALHTLATRETTLISAEGALASIDEASPLDDAESASSLFFVTDRGSRRKTLYMADAHDKVTLAAPFAADAGFLAFKNNRLFFGADNVLAAFEMVKE